ncbi:EVI2A protein, partial [Upupa epops]|nr:EVI2A protein [Upupa epops]
MKTKRHGAPRFTFPVAVIFSLCWQTRANRTEYPGLGNETQTPISPNLRGSWDATAAATDPLPSSHLRSKATTGTQTRTLQSSSSPVARNSTLSAARSAAPAAAEPRGTSRPRSPVPKETCEDSKSLVLVCFAVIAVLALTCTFLLLSTVVMANKTSSLRKAQQGKHRPRSNADLLVANSLWPSAAGTWQRLPRDTAATDFILQTLGSGRESATRRQSVDGSTERVMAQAQGGGESSAPGSGKATATQCVAEI